MSWENILWSACAAIAALVLLSAAVSDVRTREVGDMHWKVLCAAGMPCSAAALACSLPLLPVAVSFLSSVLMAAYVLSDRLGGHWALAASLVFSAVSYLMCPPCAGRAFLLSPAAFSVLFLVMYYSGMLAGGADAKAMVSLSLAFPAYPDIPFLPLAWQPLYPASFVISLPVSALISAAFISVVPMAFVGFRNASEGRLGLRMFSEYPMALKEAESSYVWPAVDVENGELIRRRPSGDPGEAFARLKAAGIEEIPVTPMIPFVAPIAAGFIAVIIAGNPLFAFVREK